MLCISSIALRCSRLYRVWQPVHLLLLYQYPDERRFNIKIFSILRRLQWRLAITLAETFLSLRVLIICSKLRTIQCLMFRILDWRFLPSILITSIFHSIGRSGNSYYFKPAGIVKLCRFYYLKQWSISSIFWRTLVNLIVRDNVNI